MQATNPYLAGVAGQTYNPYFTAGPLVPLVASDPTGAVMSPLGVPQQTVVQQKVPRGNEVRSNLHYCNHHKLYKEDKKYIFINHMFLVSGTLCICLYGFFKPDLFDKISRITFLLVSSATANFLETANKQVNFLNIYFAGGCVQAYPGVVAYKRPADKGGVPVYQPANTPSAAYQQLMQLQQPFVPVSCKSMFLSLVTTFSCLSSDNARLYL